MRNKPWLLVLFHLIAWILIFSFPYFSGEHQKSDKTTTTVVKSIDKPYDGRVTLAQKYGMRPVDARMVTNILMVPLFYLNLLLIFPWLIPQRKYGLLFLLQFGLIVIISLLELASPVNTDDRAWYWPTLTYSFTFLAAYCYYTVDNHIHLERSHREKEYENLKAELQFLRWQISPHFLFNVLNSMVALNRLKSDKLEEMLIKLSTLMRYMLYETDEKKVSLQKEAEYIQSYVYLQSMRANTDVSITCKVDVPESTDYYIEPMLLIPFVENAFKHGVGMIADPVIKVNLIIIDNFLVFTVGNKYLEGEMDNKDESTGIGLANVKRRLELLYNDQYTLDIEVSDWYYVSLQIRLS